MAQHRNQQLSVQDRGVAGGGGGHRISQSGRQGATHGGVEVGEQPPQRRDHRLLASEVDHQGGPRSPPRARRADGRPAPARAARHRRARSVPGPAGPRRRGGHAAHRPGVLAQPAVQVVAPPGQVLERRTLVTTRGERHVDRAQLGEPVGHPWVVRRQHRREEQRLALPARSTPAPRPRGPPQRPAPPRGGRGRGRAPTHPRAAGAPSRDRASCRSSRPRAACRRAPAESPRRPPAPPWLTATPVACRAGRRRGDGSATTGLVRSPLRSPIRPPSSPGPPALRPSGPARPARRGRAPRAAPARPRARNVQPRHPSTGRPAARPAVPARPTVGCRAARGCRSRAGRGPPPVRAGGATRAATARSRWASARSWPTRCAPSRRTAAARVRSRLGDQPGRQQHPGPVEREHRQHPRRLHLVRLGHLAEGPQGGRQVTGEVVEDAEVVPRLRREPVQAVVVRQVEAGTQVGACGPPGGRPPCAAPPG